MRILHSADWHLGASPGLGQSEDLGLALDLRAERFEVAARIVELAARESVDLVVLAGDTFDSPDLDEALFQKALAILDDLAPIPTLLLPGNHDPWVAGGLWERTSWKRAGDHLITLPTGEPLSVAGAQIFPCPLTQKKSRRDPTAWIPVRSEGDRSLRIGLAHGALNSLGVATNFPIDASRPDLVGLDYLALGDWHGFVQQGRCVYPGTPAATRFSEREPGNVVLVELVSEKAPEVTVVPLDSRRWIHETRPLEDATDVLKLRAELEHRSGLDGSIVRLDLRLGNLSEEARRELDDLEGFVRSKVASIDWRTEESLLSPRDLPPGLLTEVDDLLKLAAVPAETSQEEVEPSPDAWPEDLDRPPAEVAGQARLLLAQLVRDSS